MASFVLTDASVFVNAVDHSDHVKAVTVTYSRELLPATAMGDTGKRLLGGLYDWEIDLELYGDEAASKVYVLLQALVGVQTALRVRSSKTGAISATNPEYQGNGMLGSLPVVKGAVGEIAMAPVKFVGSDGVALVRDITP